MEGPRHQHLHQEWQEPLEEQGARVFRKCANKAQIALWWSLGITKDAESG